MFFIDENTGWVVVNSASEIHKTADGGQSWQLQLKTDERQYFRCINFIDRQMGFACVLDAANGSALYRTTNGGQVWTAIDLGPDIHGICSLAIVSPDLLFAAGRHVGPAVLIKSVDGGLNWTPQDIGYPLGQAIDIHFFDEHNGLLIGGTVGALKESRMVVLGTKDGGQTWQQRYLGPRNGEWGWKIAFPSRKVGYITIDSYTTADNSQDEFFLKTKDGGQTWQRKPLYTQAYRAHGVGFIDEQTGWIGSMFEERPTLFTQDGGETWHASKNGDRVNRIRFLGNGIGHAAGHRLYKIQP